MQSLSSHRVVLCLQIDNILRRLVLVAGIAGIVVGCIAALAFVALVAGLFAYWKYQAHTVSPEQV